MARMVQQQIRFQDPLLYPPVIHWVSLLNRDSLDFSLVRLNVQIPESFKVYYAG